MLRRLKMVTMVAALFAAPALAHEKGGRAMGVVESVTAQRIVMRTADGHPVAFGITPETRFLVGDKPASSRDVHVGQRAVVHGERVGDALRATEVRLGAAAK